MTGKTTKVLWGRSLEMMTSVVWARRKTPREPSGTGVRSVREVPIRTSWACRLNCGWLLRDHQDDTGRTEEKEDPGTTDGDCNDTIDKTCTPEPTSVRGSWWDPGRRRGRWGLGRQQGQWQRHRPEHPKHWCLLTRTHRSDPSDVCSIHTVHVTWGRGWRITSK